MFDPMAETHPANEQEKGGVYEYVDPCKTSKFPLPFHFLNSVIIHAIRI
mgnify:CR=1 FL=1